ncbi:hypothetical protein F4703DRAFT_1204254 [Phycomyces blakesleeanus]
MPIAIPRSSSLLAVHSDHSTSEILSNQENMASNTESEIDDNLPRPSFSRTAFDRNALRERSTRHVPRIPRLRRPYAATYPFDVRVEELHNVARIEGRDTIVQVPSTEIQNIDYNIPSTQSTTVESVLAEVKDGSYEKLLDFIAIFTDGGEYSPYYSLSNIQTNDESVYCSSNRTGSMNIKLMYCIWMRDTALAERSCVITKIIIKVPRQHTDGPCKSWEHTRCNIVTICF